MRGRANHDAGVIELSHYTTSAATSPVECQDFGFDTMRVDGDDRDTNAELEDDHQTPPWSLLAFYASHALFMANNRSYEFASIIFTASAFPDTLIAASIRGLSAHLASVLLSPTVGQWCSQQSSRLKPVRLCIIIQRTCIALACLSWLLIIKHHEEEPIKGRSEVSVFSASPFKLATFAGLIALGMIERLSAVGNEIMVERDWLPLLAEQENELVAKSSLDGPAKSKPMFIEAEVTPLVGSVPPKLYLLNATTKRIDLLAKLVTPLVVSGVALSVVDYRYVAALLAALQLASCFMEVYLTRVVWSAYPTLRAPKEDPVWYTTTTEPQIPSGSIADGARISHSSSVSPMAQLHRCVESFRAYARNPIMLASVAYAIEPFSVLTLAGSMSAYLLVAHFDLTSITIARTAGTAVEVASTIVTPLLISWFSSMAQKTGEPAARVRTRALIWVGLLGLLWQVLSLIPATAVLISSPDLSISDLNVEQSRSTKALTATLFASLALSRLGPFAYSLVEQQIIQIELGESERMAFSGIELSLIDLSELARWTMLGIFGRPEQFRWVAAASFASIMLSLGLFLCWTRRYYAVR